MSKKIKQDYEEQKRQAAESNPINQLETFHAESMTMEAHKSKEIFRWGSPCTFSCFSLGKILGRSHHVLAIQMLGYCQIEIIVMYH